MIEYASKIVWGVTAATIGYVLWNFKRLTLKIDSSYTKHETIQIVDLKLTAVKAELAALQANDARLEAHLQRLEGKIDRLLARG